MRSALLLLVVCIYGVATAVAGTSPTLDPALTESTYASGLEEPTSLTWAPDASGRLFVTLKSKGVMIVHPNGKKTMFAGFSKLYTQSECGVLGLCFHPNYAENHLVYVFLTVSASEQRIVRFRDVNNQGAERTTIIRGLPTLGINHDGGALGFGADGKLYWAVGDNGMKRGVDGDLRSLAAKVGRANADGSVPANNPFRDGAGPNNDYIWATGFRNPFSLCFQPRTGKLWLNVVGSTPDGQTQPVTGPGYEQVFVLNAGEDGGYDNFEGNQPAGARYTVPFSRPLIRPVIQYKTDDYEGGNGKSLKSMGPDNGVFYVNTTTPHGFRVGQPVEVRGTGVYDGVHIVKTANRDTQFTVQMPPGASQSARTGTVQRYVLGGCITGGCFYESTALGPEYRGNFFFGDYVSGMIMRTQLDAANQPIRCTPVLPANSGAPTDICVGPDGALYYSDIAGSRIQRLGPADSHRLIVTPDFLPMQEGGSGVVTVRLPSAPATAVTVQVHKVTDGGSVTLASDEDLVFTPENWATPQAVKIRALVDADLENSTAELSVSASGYSPETVQIAVTDTSATAPVLSTNVLTVPEGRTAAFQVKLATAPRRPVTLSVRRTEGSNHARLVSGASLIFTPQNWNVPRKVQISAPADGNSVNETAVFTVAGPGYSSRSLTVSVVDDDPSAPSFTSTPPSYAVVGLPFTYQAEASGVPAPTFSLVNAPEGVAIGETSGLVTWTPQATGLFGISLRAQNGQEPLAQQEIALHVVADEPPAATIIRPTAGETVSGTASEFFGNGSDDYACTKAEFYIDGNLVYTDANRDGHYHLGGAHNLWDTTALPNGAHTLMLRVEDDKGQSGSATVQVTVQN